MMQRRAVNTILQECKGTTIIEFAVVAPVFFLLFFAVLELGLLTFTQIALETAVAQTGRDVSISSTKAVGFDRLGAFSALLKQKTQGLINSENLAISANVLNAEGGGGTEQPDICLTNPPSTPATCPTGTPFQDLNANGMYDGPGGVNLGNSGDAVEVRASLPWQVQFPFLKELFGPNGVVQLSATTVIKNE